MCHSIKIDKYGRLAQITARGSVNVLELKEIFLETVEHRDWQAGFKMLCDYRGIVDFAVTTRDIDNINEWQASIDAVIGDGKCAVVASRDSVFGMSRMWEMISTERSQRICVFRELEDAESWLGIAYLKLAQDA
jgi:hypothetical protein